MTIKRHSYLAIKNTIRFFKERGVDTFVVSYPKSGRTWLRLLIGKAICSHFGIPEGRMLESYRLSSAAGIDRIQFTHDGTSAANARPFSQLSTDKSRYARKKVLFLTRDIPDILVSFYLHATRRVRPVYQFEGNVGDFIRDPRYGAEKILSFYEIWYRNQHVPQDFMWLTYEDLHADAGGALRRVLKFVGAPELKEDTIVGAVEFCKFSNMRRLEETDHFNSRELKNHNSDHPDAFKVRRGLIGAYGEVLSGEDIAYLNAVMTKRGNPFFRLAGRG